MLLLLARRAVHLVTLAATISIVTFAASAWAPGSGDDPLRLEAGYSAGAAANFRLRNRLDRSLADRVGLWLASVARGDLGISTEYDAPVAPLVLARAGRTVFLGLAATSVAWVIALPMGVWMAARAGSWYDRGCRAFLAFLLALPEPVLALGLMMFAVRTGLLPAGGMLSVRGQGDAASMAGTGADFARHLALPTVVLAAGLLPTLVRHVRSSVAAALGARFVMAARARGVPRRRLLFRCALRVAAAPLISLFGLSVASLLSASLLVEVVTGWPGLGPLLVEATRARDIPLVAGVSVCSIVLLSAGTGLAEVAVRLADPRLGSRG